MRSLKVNNSAFRREVLLGRDTPDMRAAALALAAFVGPPVYEELRTRQQLGYIVFGGAGNEDRTEFAYFIVQSGDYPADVLEARADAVIGQLPAQLEALPDADWQTIIAGVRAKLLEKDKSVAERAGRLFGLAYERDADWARNEATVAALASLTKQRTAAILAEALAPKTARTRTFLGFARDHKPPGAAGRELHRRRALEGAPTLRLKPVGDARGARQCRLYCVAPNKTSRALSSISGLRSAASTSTPRITAGRWPISSNQPFRCGKSAQSMPWFFHERSHGKIAMSAMLYSGPPRYWLLASRLSITPYRRLASLL